MIQYMYTKKLGVSIFALSVIDNVGVIIYYFAFFWIINKINGVPLWKLFIIGNISGLITVLQMTVFFDLPTWVQIASRFIVGLIGGLQSDFFMLPLVGRVSKYLPEGFESTGIVVIISSLNFTATLSSKFGAIQQDDYMIKDGYYERGLPLFVVDYAIQVLLAVVAPIFLAWG